jgi:hypothetical protein
MTIAINTIPSAAYVSKEYIVTVTAADTLANNFYGTCILNSTANFTLTVGTAANNNKRMIKFINISSGEVAVSDGSTVTTISESSAGTIASDGTAWRVFAFAYDCMAYA